MPAVLNPFSAAQRQRGNPYSRASRRSSAVYSVLSTATHLVRRHGESIEYSRTIIQCVRLSVVCLACIVRKRREDRVNRYPTATHAFGRKQPKRFWYTSTRRLTWVVLCFKGLWIAVWGLSERHFLSQSCGRPVPLELHRLYDDSMATSTVRRDRDDCTFFFMIAVGLQNFALQFLQTWLNKSVNALISKTLVKATCSLLLLILSSTVILPLWY